MNSLVLYYEGIGTIYAVSDGAALKGLWMEGQRYFAGKLGTIPPVNEQDPVLIQTREWLNRYFSGQRPVAEELPLSPDGTEFQMEVWRILRTIPYGHTMTYGEIADAIAERHGLNRFSARAVGSAVGHNPISIVIPCHRVIGSGGELTGYAGGLEKKKFLLRTEGLDPDHLPH